MQLNSISSFHVFFDFFIYRDASKPSILVGTSNPPKPAVIGHTHMLTRRHTHENVSWSSEWNSRVDRRGDKESLSNKHPDSVAQDVASPSGLNEPISRKFSAQSENAEFDMVHLSYAGAPISRSALRVVPKCVKNPVCFNIKLTFFFPSPPLLVGQCMLSFVYLVIIIIFLNLL